MSPLLRHLKRSIFGAAEIAKLINDADGPFVSRRWQVALPLPTRRVSGYTVALVERYGDSQVFVDLIDVDSEGMTKR